MDIDKEDYYSIGSPEDVVISNSSYKYINPDEGGSFKKFETFLKEGSDIKSPSLENGKLLHLMCENKGIIHEADTLKPSGYMGAIADLVIERSLIKKGTYDESLLLQAARDLSAYNNMKDETLKEKIEKEAGDYILEKLNNIDKIFLTKPQYKTVTSCFESLNSNSEIQDVILKKGKTEVPIIWKEGSITKKALLDKIIVNGAKVTIVDYKTTSKPVSQFVTYNVLDVGSPNLDYKKIAGSFFHYRYYRQMAHYIRAVRSIFTHKVNVEILIPVVETVEPYENTLLRLEEDDLVIRAGNTEIDFLDEYVLKYINNYNTKF